MAGQDEVRSSFEPVESDGGTNELLEQQSEYIEIPTPDFENTYKNIKSLIFDGFIPVTLNICDYPVVVKALSLNEFRYIDILGTSDEDKIALYFLYSMVLFDGESVIPIRKQMHREAIEIFRTIPTAGLNQVSTLINSTQRYYNSNYETLEAFLYEHEARAQWVISKKEALNKTLLYGHSDIGWNTAQEVWIGFNQREDKRETDDRDFSNAKFIASAMVGDKEIKKISIREQLRWTEELKRRQGVRLHKKEHKLVLSNPTYTAKDLVGELLRQIKGEKDLHDKIIDEHERKLAVLSEKRAKDFEEAQIKAAMAITQHGALSGGSRPITQQEMNDHLKKVNTKKINVDTDSSNRYLEKVMSTTRSTVAAPPQKSIFSPEVQDALKKLKK